MTENKSIFLRAHTEVVKLPTSRRTKTAKQKPDSQARRQKGAAPPKWPEYALVFDCESTTDASQALTFGAFRFCRIIGNTFFCVEEGIFYNDDLPETDPDGLRILKHYVKTSDAETPQGYPRKLLLLSRSEFAEYGLWGAGVGAKALVVGFNLPFDLSRLAIDNKNARDRNEGWSLVMFQDKDPESGKVRENPFRPRVIVTPKDSKAAFIRFAGISKRSKKTKQRLIPYTAGRFLDLRTFGWALRNKSYSLQLACEDFGLHGKLDHKPTGRVSAEEIEYCRQDVRATVALLNEMRCEFDRHPIDLQPEHAYSPASIAKTYLNAMGMIPPLQKFDIPANAIGSAMQGYYGGRAEARIRHTVVPVVHTDFMSEYPTVNSLLGLWQFVIAKNLRIEDATDDVRKLLKEVTPEKVFEPDFWKEFAFFALVQPAGDVLPVRTDYSGTVSNIGINPLTSKEPIWYAGPDLIAATLLTGRPPSILRAFRLVPEGQQAGLKPVSLRGMIEIDPRRDDFFKRVIEARAQVRQDSRLPEGEREALHYFLKILANAGSYGLFVEVNPERVGTDEKTGRPARAKLRVFSGEQVFDQTAEMIENSGPWYCPLFAALITAGGRLLLALLERTVTDEGGNYLLCDTDSMAIVASETGAIVPCVGGDIWLPDDPEGEDEAIQALSWADVRRIVTQFDRLNPYDRNTVRDPILKIEKVNFGPDGKQREICGYAIAAKRYALFSQKADGDINVVKASAHGLGFLYPPKKQFDSSADAPVWVVEAWGWILRKATGLPCETPPWFDLSAMMRFTITTPQVLKVLQARQRDVSYRDRTKPFNFIVSPILDELDGCPIGTDPNRFMLIAPFSSNPEEWHRLPYVNVYDGKQYQLGKRGKRLPYEAEPKTYGDVVSQYRWHPEAKSLAPDGNICSSQTRGLLRRTPVTADGFRYIGKETDRRWEQGEDLSMVDPHLLEYHPNETARLITDPVLQRDARRVSIRALARKACVSDRTVKAARKGRCLRKSTIEKLRKAVKNC